MEGHALIADVLVEIPQANLHVPGIISGRTIPFFLLKWLQIIATTIKIMCLMVHIADFSIPFMESMEGPNKDANRL